MVKRTAWLAMPAVVLLGLAACSSDDDDTSESTASLEETASSDTADTDAGQQGEDEGNGEPLGTTQGQHRATPNDATLVPLTIEVTRLDRNGELVELSMSVTNNSDAAEFAPYDVFNPDFLSTQEIAYDVQGIGLVDQEGRKVYLPVVDSAGICLCSDVGDLRIPAGGTGELHATFGGLPDDVATVDLHVPGFEPLTALEVRS
jgi:hypothetical protein